jgi:glucokinase
MARYIGVDLGGTNLRGALFEGEALKKRAHRATMSERGPEPILRDIARLILELAGDEPIEAVGVGFPGIVNPAEGTVRIPPNLPDWERVDALPALQDALEFPVYIENDANLFALGEWTFGAGKGCRDLVALTLGTGVGGGIILGGRLIRGHQCAGAEPGHTTIDIDGPPCGCGNQGCIESFAGGAHFDERAREWLAWTDESSLLELDEITAEKAFDAAERGDPGALRVWELYGSYLGVGIVNLLHIFAPEVVILGGKIATAMRFLRKDLEDTVRERWMGFEGRSFRLEEAGLGDDGALYGAWVLASRGGEV